MTETDLTAADRIGAGGNTVGFIGLGTMGSGIAANLQAAGTPLVVHDRRREAAEQVAEHPVLGHVGLQAGAVDDEVRGDLLQAGVGAAGDQQPAAVRRHRLGLAADRPVPALGPAAAQLLLPVPPHRRVGAADQLVQRLVEGFADGVPERDVDRRDRA